MQYMSIDVFLCTRTEILWDMLLITSFTFIDCAFWMSLMFSFHTKSMFLIISMIGFSTVVMILSWNIEMKNSWKIVTTMMILNDSMISIMITMLNTQTYNYFFKPKFEQRFKNGQAHEFVKKFLLKRFPTR